MDPPQIVSHLIGFHRTLNNFRYDFHFFRRRCLPFHNHTSGRDGGSIAREQLYEAGHVAATASPQLNDLFRGSIGPQ